MKFRIVMKSFTGKKIKTKWLKYVSIETLNDFTEILKRKNISYDIEYKH